MTNYFADLALAILLCGCVFIGYVESVDVNPFPQFDQFNPENLVRTDGETKPRKVTRPFGVMVELDELNAIPNNKPFKSVKSKFTPFKNLPPMLISSENSVTTHTPPPSEENPGTETVTSSTPTLIKIVTETIIEVTTTPAPATSAPTTQAPTTEAPATPTRSAASSVKKVQCSPDLHAAVWGGRVPVGNCVDTDNLDSFCSATFTDSYEASAALKDCNGFLGSWCCYLPPNV